jgi:two-component system, LytTR family, sensor kinase
VSRTARLRHEPRIWTGLVTTKRSDAFELGGREITLIFLFWTSLAMLSTLNRLLDARDFGFGRVISPAGPITLAFVEAWTWALLTPLIFWLSNQASGASTRWVQIPLLLVAGVCVAVVVFLMLDFARDAIVTVPVRRRGGGGGLMLLRGIGRFRFLNQFTVYCAVLAAGFAREYFLRDRRRSQDAVILQAQLAEARLDALRMQINPHFLFNTLNAVAALVERDPAGVRRMIARLSELLRHTIDSRATDEIGLEEEIAFVRRYIEIMEVRFQGQLEVNLAIDPGVNDALVPNLILQPLVENAFEHGVGRSSAVGKIEISARRDDEHVEISVRDNGPGISDVSHQGIGLTNTRARLEQMYGEEASLVLRRAMDGGAVAILRLPYHTKADLRSSGAPLKTSLHA